MRTASIIDYPRDELDQSIWNVSGDKLTLQPQIQEQIADIVESFLDDMDLGRDAVIDVFLYGSLLTNQFNSQTDLDARILLDAEVVHAKYPGVTGDDIYEMVRDTIHGIPLGATTHPFNATVVIEGDETELGQAELGITDKDPVYSLLSEEIIQIGELYKQDFDPDKEFSEERDEVSEIMDKLDKLIQDTRSDTIDFTMIDEAVQDVSDPETLITKLDDKRKEIEEDISKLVDEYIKLRDDRTDSYKNAPEDDRHKAPGNVRYKMLEKYKYIDLLKQVKKILDNQNTVLPEEIPELEQVLEASYSLQYGPNYDNPAPPTSITGPAAPVEQNPLSFEDGGMMHGASCPHCGSTNNMAAKEEGQEVECQACGKRFKPDAMLHTSPGENTVMENAPYESDIPVYGNTPISDEEIDRAMTELGINPDITKKFKEKIKSPQVPNNDSAQQVQQPNQQNTTQPSTTQQTLKPMQQIGQAVEKEEDELDEEINLIIQRQDEWNALRQEFVDSADVFQEYKEVDKDNYAAILKEMSDPDYPVRVQWYNSQYPVGHSSVPSLTDAAERIFDDLGPNIERADGSMDQFAVSDAWIEEIKQYTERNRGGAVSKSMLNRNAALVKRAVDILHHQKEYKMAGKKAWFDEPSSKEPGGSPYPDSQGLAEAGDEKKDKAKEKKKERKRDKLNQDDNVMEIITVLEGIDIIPFLEDEELLEDLLKEFPIMGEPCPKLDKMLSKYMKTALPTDPAPGTGQYDAPGDTADYETEPDEEKQKDLEFVKEVGEEAGIDWAEVEFSPQDLYDGIVVELEHGTTDPATDVTGDDILETVKIAWAHLKEFPDYYARLKTMEKGKVGAAYMTLCPNCKSIQRTDLNEGAECKNCKYPVPAYKVTHPEYETPDEKEERKEAKKINVNSASLDRSVGSKINRDFEQVGLDGNGTFERPASALGVINGVLANYNIQMDGMAGADYNLQTAPQGSLLIDIEFINEEDSFSPEPIDNLAIKLTWYERDKDNYEVLAYVTV